MLLYCKFSKYFQNPRDSCVPKWMKHLNYRDSVFHSYTLRILTEFKDFGLHQVLNTHIWLSWRITFSMFVPCSGWWTHIEYISLHFVKKQYKFLPMKKKKWIPTRIWYHMKQHWFKMKIKWRVLKFDILM